MAAAFHMTYIVVLSTLPHYATGAGEAMLGAHLLELSLDVPNLGTHVYPIRNSWLKNALPSYR